ISQKTIEYFLEQHQISDPDQKAKVLPAITDIVYEYNMNVVEYEKEEDEYKKKKITEELKETESKIGEMIKEALGS
ncbi:MAG: hypothetical protein WC323_02435, partial [Patescibacteria group bacterium]